MLNYIGVFLTFRCNLGCDYCINHHGEFQSRREITPDEWLDVLKDVQTREDLPITLQGGEPMEYGGIYQLIMGLHLQGHKLDLLTNGCFNVDEFLRHTSPEMFQRKAPYASIRFSFHKKTDEFLLLDVVHKLKRKNYSVGIWGLDHPDMAERNDMMYKVCHDLGIDFRMKSFLDQTHGDYKYPDAITGRKYISVRCYPSELLFAPDGARHPCHHFLYANGFSVARNRSMGPIVCGDYGCCNPCDVKLKTNRLQEGGHCSVRIERI